MRAFAAVVVAILALSSGACKSKKTEVTTPTVDVDVGTKKDTINTPGITTKPETVIVNKPVITPPPPQQ